VKPLVVSSFTTTSAAGIGAAALLNSLKQRKSGLRANDFKHADLKTWIGRVEHLEHEPVIKKLSDFDCRNNRLAQLGLNQDHFILQVDKAREKYGANRIGVLLGTSTSGILETELGYRVYAKDNAFPANLKYEYSQSLFSLADFVRRYLDLAGPAFTISTACSSSAKVFASAYRFRESGLCDAVVVGGVDSLTLTTLYGFLSLELLADEMCRPCDADRKGISIGEAAGFALLEKQGQAEGEMVFLSYGESSDAYHMSTPHPEGEGARHAMQRALSNAGLIPRDINYINMHGTATAINDSVEDKAIANLFGNKIPCSSTKGWTGHTLGAAGITEAAISLLCLSNDLIPGTINTQNVDPQFNSQVLLQNKTTRLNRVLSNSFGFGGNNCSLIFGRAT
jgi:3-oxoacyl-[acyl-carrier-protein] synthase-1